MLPRVIVRWVAVFLVGALACGCRSGAASNFSPGFPAPHFTLQTLDGSARSLHELRGKVVLLNFWASWCGPCIAEIPSLERLYTTLKPDGFEILAVGIDDQPEDLEEFRRKYSMTFPIVVDAGARVKHMYRLTGVPESFLIDRAGNFVMMLDPDDNAPVVRIVGPREWDTPNAVARIKKILDKQN